MTDLNERAEKILIIADCARGESVDRRSLITAELRSVVEEDTADRLNPNWPECESADKWIRMGKSEAYADAARIADEVGVDSEEGREVARRIRAKAKEKL